MTIATKTPTRSQLAAVERYFDTADTPDDGVYMYDIYIYIQRAIHVGDRLWRIFTRISFLDREAYDVSCSHWNSDLSQRTNVYTVSASNSPLFFLHYLMCASRHTMLLRTAYIPDQEIESTDECIHCLGLQ